MSRTIGIPEGEGAVGLVLRLVDLTIRPQVAPVDIAVDGRADLRAVEGGIEYAAEAVRHLSIQGHLPQALIPSERSRLPVAIEVAVWSFSLEILLSPLFTYPR